jgi:hypothetical protein
MEPGKDNNDYIERLRNRVNAHLDNNALPPHLQQRLSIRYPETLPGQEGEVIYIQASLTSKVPQQGDPSPVKESVQLPNVPGDVQNYQLRRQDFSHDSTAEQWVTESQFESYRRLGQCVAEKIDRRFTPR